MKRFLYSPFCAIPIPENPIRRASSTRASARGPYIRMSAPIDCKWADFGYPPDSLLCFSHLTPDVIGSAPSLSRNCCNIFMKFSSMCENPQPHLHCISARLKLGVSISTMSAPAVAIKVRRNISDPLHKFPAIDF